MNHFGKRIFSATFFILLLTVSSLSSAQQNEKSHPESQEGNKSPLNENERNPPLPPEPVSLSSEEQQAEDALKESLKDENYVLEALELLDYNIYFHLPKVTREFDVLYAPYPRLSYGPYEIDKKIYQRPWLTLEEIDQRISVLRDVIAKDNIELNKSVEPGEKAKADEGAAEEKKNPAEDEARKEELLYKKIHLADLMTIRSRITGSKKDVFDAVKQFAEVFPETTGDFFPYVALNFVNSLLLKQDVITALPVIKKIYREYRSQKDFMRHLNASLLDLYFLASRYKKAWEDLEEKIKQKTIDSESLDYKLRVGDLLFFMQRYKEAAEWYQSVLKPNPNATLSENISWLYLAESVFRTGDRSVALKIYEAMLPYFRGTAYEDVINYRIDESMDNAKRIIQHSQNQNVRNWIRVEMMKQDFVQNPQNYALENFDIITSYGRFDEELMQQVMLMKAKYHEIENEHMEALKLYMQIIYDVDNQYVGEALNKAIASAVMRRGLSTANEMEAIEFLRFLRKFEFNLRFEDPDHIYQIVLHNMRLLGMMDVAAGQALHIIDKTIHTPSSKMSIYLKMANALFDARADKSAIKVMDVIDTNLISFDEKQSYNRLRALSMIRSGRYTEVLSFLQEWSNQGTDAEMLYWVTLRKVEVLEKMERYAEALKVIEDNIGEGKIDELPESFDKYTDALIAYQVIFNNKIGKNYESLLGFYANKARAMRSEMKLAVILAAVSSALALNKTDDVTKLMVMAKENFNSDIYAWLEKWTRGEMWINQIGSYLERKDVATQY